ncbi:MAG: imidazole glycerol phosphate synthase subunit HisH [Alphaproteobacteria bacterium]
MSLVIIDTGCANLSSVAFAFERLGVAAHISDDVSTIKAAEHLVLPGVGAAPYALAKIQGKGLTQTLKSLTQPVMGICLGMQLLYDTVTEGGDTIEGLGLIPGDVTKLDTKFLPSPHMGWNSLDIVRPHALLDGIKPSDYAYFVHSYAAPVSAATIAKSTHGSEFSAVVAHKNVYGCQFHPERSSRTGAQILKNFLSI